MISDAQIFSEGRLRYVYSENKKILNHIFKNKIDYFS